jgi:hypothetical protein
MSSPDERFSPDDIARFERQRREAVEQYRKEFEEPPPDSPAVDL